MNTHWIDYLPGGVARVTDKEPVDKALKQATCPDVNRLSQIVVKFNDMLANPKIFADFSVLLTLCKTL
jgi:hypothetical protein